MSELKSARRRLDRGARNERRGKASPRSGAAASGPAPGERLRVNPIKCAAHGLCAELLPEFITLDPWGYPVVPDEPVPEELRGLARKAAAACPTLALLPGKDAH